MAIRLRMMSSTRRKGKEVAPTLLSRSNPKLSLLRDKDKLLFVPTHHHLQQTLEQRPRPFQSIRCGEIVHLEEYPATKCCCHKVSCNSTKSEDDSNGHRNSFNKYLMVSIKDLWSLLVGTLVGASLPFVKSVSPCARIRKNEWNNDSCTESATSLKKDRKRLNARKTSCSNDLIIVNQRKMFSLGTALVVCFLLTGDLMKVVNSTPLASIPEPTQAPILARYPSDTDGVNTRVVFQEKYENRRYPHGLYSKNTTDGGRGNAGTDEAQGMKNDSGMSGIDINSRQGRVLENNVGSNGSIKNNTKTRSGTKEEFTSLPVNNRPQDQARNRTNNNNNKSKIGYGTKSEIELMTMPLAVRIKTGTNMSPSSLSSSDGDASTYKEHLQQEQHHYQSVIHLTNDLSHEMKENRLENNESDEKSLGLINRNDDNRDSIDSESAPTVNISSDDYGACWHILVGDDNANNTMTVPSPTATPGSSYMKLLASNISGNESNRRMMCNNTSNLANALDWIPDNFAQEVVSIIVKDSLISSLNLSLFHRFPNLKRLSVTHSNVSKIVGTCPPGLKALNISYNVITYLNGSIFTIAGEKNDYEDEVAEHKLEVVRVNDGNNFKTNFSAKLLPPHVSSSLSENLQKGKIPQKLFSEIHRGKMPQPASQANTKLAKTNSFLSTEENPNELGESESGSVFEAPTVHDIFVKPTYANIESESGGTESETLETAETDESSDDEGSDISRPIRKYGIIGANINTNEKRNLAVISASSAAGFPHNKETNPDCASSNDNLCKGESFLRRSRETRVPPKEYGAQKSDNNRQTRRSDERRTRSDLKNDGFITSYEGDEDNEASSESSSDSSERRVDYYGRHYENSRTLDQDKRVDAAGNGMPDKWDSNIKGTSQKGADRKRRERPSEADNNSNAVREEMRLLSLEDIDLSHNKVTEIPKALLQLESLKSLRLSGNQLKRDFVWEKLADWYMNSHDPNILADGDETLCGVVDDVRVFQFTVLGVLKAKKDFVETCRSVDKNICHECGLYALNKVPGQGYNLSHQSPHGNVAIALKLDCSYRNLSELPVVPPQTWQLNISGNNIKDLVPLKQPMYENLLILDADSNEISTLEGLAGTAFLDRYNYLSLQRNRISVIPPSVLSSLKTMRGQGVTLLGDNFIDCDCDTVKDIKPLLLENSKKIKDLKDIFCKDMKTRSGNSFMAVKDIQYTDLCYLDSEETNELYLYLVIFIEVLLIFLIVAKVWHDQRTFRRTGILPWCSAKMPRLPCDAMLESVKEPPHFNRSSSTNVRSYTDPPQTQSISSCVQLREVRSNSGQSEKSSQISQLSSFPGSSRTSSV